MKLFKMFEKKKKEKLKREDLVQKAYQKGREYEREIINQEIRLEKSNCKKLEDIALRQKRNGVALLGETISRQLGEERQSWRQLIDDFKAIEGSGANTLKLKLQSITKEYEKKEKDLNNQIEIWADMIFKVEDFLVNVLNIYAKFEPLLNRTIHDATLLEGQADKMKDAIRIVKQHKRKVEEEGVQRNLPNKGRI